MTWVGRRPAASVVALAALVLAGCTTPVAVAPGTDRVSGRLSIQVEATPDQAAQRLSALFDLSGSPTEGALRLSSTALGTTLAEARWTPQAATLRTPAGVTNHADLDDLSQRMLGERLPMAALMSWLRGTPWPEAPHVAQPPGFEQMGWHIDLARWPVGELTASRLTPPRVQVLVQRDPEE